MIQAGSFVYFLFIFSMVALSGQETVSWRHALDQDPEWYGSEEAIRIADNLLVHQHETGGWPKNIDMARELGKEEIREIEKKKQDPGTGIGQPTIDNGATYTQMRYLARVFENTEKERFKKGFLKGIDYLLEARYENGGWPQYHPIREGYYENITFNDGAMIGVMRILRDVAQGMYEFVDPSRRRQAELAVEKGVEVILKTQIIAGGVPTAWCAQYHPVSLEPAGARAYELPSISGSESVGIVAYLMGIEDPSPAVIRAVRHAVRWFELVKIEDIRVIRKEDPSLPKGYDLLVGFDPAGNSPLWARFYEIGTNYPIFVDRDGVVRYALSEISHERRVGYRWLGSWAESLLLEYPSWCEKHAQDPQCLAISDNRRTLVDENGDHFFWLGDTGWLLFKKLNRQEAAFYLDNRLAKGFNVIQAMVIHDLGDCTNDAGDRAFEGTDITRPIVTAGNDPESEEEYDYWDHVDYIIDLAAEKGIYMALVPIWGSNVKSHPLTADHAAGYGKWLAERYRDRKNIIWLNGGDIRGSDSTGFWLALGSALKTNAPDHLVTFHPFGRTQSSTWFHNESWLDFNMFQSGHRRYDQDDTELAYGEDNWRYVRADYSLVPVKPTIDGEPSYEGVPQGLHDTTQPLWNDDDVRRYAYWSVFEGAFGFTYGHNEIMQFFRPGEDTPAYGAKHHWKEALEAPGADQLLHLKNLYLSRSPVDRVPDPGLAACKQGEKYDFVAACRGKDHAFLYTFTGRNIDVAAGRIGGNKVQASWYDPRTGELTGLGVFENSGILIFDPPGDPGNGNDWVLILDSMP